MFVAAGIDPFYIERLAHAARLCAVFAAVAPPPPLP
jgi:hypothetical protein